MPPKPKFSREEIAAAALCIVKEKGVAALTARELGRRLGSSSRPIFTTFKNMDEVKWAARELALKEFEGFAGNFREYTPAFKQIGMLMVSYSISEPEIFKLLFMQEHKEGHDFNNTISDLGEMATTSIELIQHDYDMTADEAKTLFEQMWVHTFGMGALCAMKVCDFTEDEVSEMLGQVFAGMVMMIKQGKLKYTVGKPVRLTDGTFYGKSVSDLPYIND